MKRSFQSIMILGIFLVSCGSEPDFNISNGSTIGNGNGTGTNNLPGTPATFTIIHNDTTFIIEGDAYSVGYGFFDGPGSAMHREVDSYYTDPLEYYYQLDCIGSYQSKMYLAFEFHTTSLGQPIESFTTGTYYARNTTFYHGDEYYQAFHFNDPAINQQLYAVIQVTSVHEGRIDGTFKGKFYQTSPVEGKLVEITGTFKNVYVHEND